jgi:hypothetical protein
MRFSKRYFALTSLVLVVETFIALAMDDAFVRPYVGDTLAVVLLYAALLSALPLRRLHAAVLAFLCACGVELAQAFDAVERLGLSHVPAARVILGTHFDPYDLCAYAAALPLLVVLERHFARAAHLSNSTVLARLPTRDVRTKSRHPTP